MLRSLQTLGAETNAAIQAYVRAADRTSPPGAITALSECNRRATSALADLVAAAYEAFLTELPRGPMIRLAASLARAVGEAFSAVIAIPASTSLAPQGGSHSPAQLAALSSMGAWLAAAVEVLPRYAKGRRPAAPDAFRFLSEQTNYRAARALVLSHRGASGSPSDRVFDALDGAFQDLLLLVMESV